MKTNPLSLLVKLMYQHRSAVMRSVSTTHLLLLLVLAAYCVLPGRLRAQQSNHALAFQANDFATMGTMDLSGEEVTIAAWVHPDRFPNTLHTIAGIERSGEAAALLRVGDTGIDPSRPQFVLRIGESQVKLNAEETLDTRRWQHVAASYDGRKMRIFIDGDRVGTRRLSGQVEARGTFRVGKSFGGRYFHGMIDEVQVWRNGLYESFLRNSHVLALSGDERRLEAYWQFNEGGGTRVEDHTGNGHSGTLRGARWTRSAAPLQDQESTNSAEREPVQANGFMLEFPDARYSHLQRGNDQFFVGKALVRTDHWRVKQMKDYLYHLQVPGWPGYFWKINTSRRAAYSVEGTYGRYGGRETQLDFRAEPQGTSLEGFVLELSTLYFYHTPDQTRLLAEGKPNDRGTSKQESVLAREEEWQVKRMNREIFQIRQSAWNERYWQVNLDTREAYIVEGGDFGTFGGEKEPIDAEVTRLNGE